MNILPISFSGKFTVSRRFDKKVEELLKRQKIDYIKEDDSLESYHYDKKELKEIVLKLINGDNGKPSVRYMHYIWYPLICVDTKKINELFKKSPQYVGRGCDLIGKDKELYENSVKCALCISTLDAPLIHITENDKGKPEIYFERGKYDYAVMRDLRIKKIPISMDEKSISLAKKHQLIN